MSTGDRRVCLLTGAGGTFGNAFCARYGEEYAILAVAGTRAPTVPSQHERYVDPLAPAAELEDNAGAVHVVHADLTDATEQERVIEVALARFGGVDLLVNAAARTDGYRHTILDGDAALADLEQHLLTNVVAPAGLAVRLAQRFWKHRVAENRARNRNLVNLSSTSALEVYAHRGQAGYAASKAALNSLTGHLAAEFATIGVRANVVVPTTFPTLVPTEEVVDAVVAYDRDDATGSAYVVAAGDE